MFDSGIDKNINNNNNNSSQYGTKQPASVNHSIDFDIMGFLRVLLANWKLLVICLIIGVALGGVYKNMFVSHLYRADTNIVVSDTGTIISISDLSISSELSTDYIQILTSRTTLNEVIEDLNLNMSYGQLGGIISVTQNEGSHIFNISATTSDRNVSQQIANATMNIGMKRVQDILTECEVTVVDPASDESTIDVTPGYRNYVLVGGVIGLLIPIIFLLILQLMDVTFRNEEEVEAKLDLPILARIPYYPGKNMVKDKLNYYEKEAFNTLYGSINLSGDDIRVISVTSASPNEGKSSVAYKLAETITEYGKTVMFMDCDMRNSTFCRNYGINKNDYPGISGFLSGNATLREAAITDDKNERLLILPPGKNPPNPSVLIAGNMFSTLIKTARKNCDYVILDTPPVNAVIDGVYASKASDGTVMIVDGGASNRNLTMRAKIDLESNDCNLLGVAINKINKKRAYGKGAYGYGRYGRRGYGYGYGKKGGYGYGYGYGYGEPDGDKADKDTEQSKSRRKSKGIKKGGDD